MIPSTQNIVDLSAQVAEVTGREAALVITAEGRIIASDIDLTGPKAAWIGEVCELAKAMASLLQDSTVSGLENGLVEGSLRKVFIRRSTKLGFFIVFLGGKTMDIRQAAKTARNISSDMEAAVRSKK